MSYCSPATSRAARLPKLFAVIVAEPPCSYPAAALCPSPASNLQYLDIKLSGEVPGKKILTSRYFAMGRAVRPERCGCDPHGTGSVSQRPGQRLTSDDLSMPIPRS